MPPTTRDRITAAAKQWLGTPYVWGGESREEGGVDCSGLIIAAYRAAGVPLPGRPIASQLGQMGREVPLNLAQPGDVVYRDQPGPTDHVALYLGGGQVIEAPTVGQSVRITPISSWGGVTSIRRLPQAGVGRGVMDSGPAGDEYSWRSWIPGYQPGELPGDADDVGVDPWVTDWGADALQLGLVLVGTLAAVGLVAAGVMNTVKD